MSTETSLVTHPTPSEYQASCKVGSLEVPNTQAWEAETHLQKPLLRLPLSCLLIPLS